MATMVKCRCGAQVNFAQAAQHRCAWFRLMQKLYGKGNPCR